MAKKLKKASAEPIPAPAPAPKPEPTTEAPATGKFAGIGTMVKYGIPAGLRRNAFQDALLAYNETAHLSDEELAQIMDDEHPEGGVRIVSRPNLVAVIRRFYNAGTHGKQQGGVPKVQSRRYENGKPVEETPRAKMRKAS